MYIDIVAMQLYLVDLTGTGVATMSSLAHLWDWDTEEQRQNRHVADWEWKCQKWAATCDAYRAIRLFFWIWNIRLVPLRWEPSFIPRPIYPVCVSAPGLVWIWDLDQMKHCWIKLTPEHLVKLLLLQTRPVMKLDMSLGLLNLLKPARTIAQGKEPGLWWSLTWVRNGSTVNYWSNHWAPEDRFFPLKWGHLTYTIQETFPGPRGVRIRELNIWVSWEFHLNTGRTESYIKGTG